MKFENPPIAEIVLGVQFAPLTSWSSGHSGWFWKSYLGQEWTQTVDSPPIGDLFEQFGDEQRWVMPGLSLSLSPALGPGRLQITNASGERMIQIQATRFHYNWKKGKDQYPSYETIKAEFDKQLARFEQFIRDSGAGEFTPNQWELTYVDHVHRGKLWDSPADWHKVFPGLFAPPVVLDPVAFERTAGEWTYTMKDYRGRVHVQAHHGKASSQDAQEMLSLQTTARGPIRPEKKWNLSDGLTLGHGAIGSLFKGLCSPAARQEWREVRG